MIAPMPMTRREHFASLAAFALLIPTLARAADGQKQAFSWPILIARAKALAGKPWQPIEDRSHAQAIDYDAVGAIGYRPDKTLWSDHGSGGVRFFPLSRYARMPVEISVVAAGQSSPFRYDPALFEAKSADLTALLAKSDGFAGFRAMNPGGVGDWLAFQGASYFRSAGPLNQYGLSARGLAINTSVPGMAEEFPAFTHFWLERGAGGDLIIYALLDSPSITGAYRFVNRRTDRAVVQDVSVALFARKDIAQLGIAPLTSMFWYNEGNRAQAVDWRPEIHDSDGLALLTGKGERIWRPLVNPPRPATGSFFDQGPRGFGLLQRDRAFDHYQDDGVFYQKRPSLWVEPRGNWGAGAVTLFEIPTTRETDDNIVAFWTPARSPRRGQRLDYAYQLSWISEEPQPITVARASDVWLGTAGRPGHDPIPNARKIVIDFVGGDLDRFGRNQVTPLIEVKNGTLLNASAYPVQESRQHWRLTADIARNSDQASDLRVFLRADDNALTETVLYQVDWPDG
jgi:periplasmic glucans biosynthesis protein